MKIFIKDASEIIDAAYSAINGALSELLESVGNDNLLSKYAIEQQLKESKENLIASLKIN